MDSKTALRQIKIKTGVLKRCVKEYQSYQQEKVVMEEKFEKLKADNAEEGVLRRAEECVADCVAVLPSLAQKVNAGIPELQALLEENGDNEELVQTEDWAVANQQLAAALAFAETI